jgi:hypothetical protein
MSAAAQPLLEPGRAYRTRELAQWGKNPTRLAQRLVQEGKLREAAHGLYYAPMPSRFGPAPTSDHELLRGFLGPEPFVITGPAHWNALGLGSTAMFAQTLVYNTRRSAQVLLDGRCFWLRRVCFPNQPRLCLQTPQRSCELNVNIMILIICSIFVDLFRSLCWAAACLRYPVWRGVVVYRHSIKLRRFQGGLRRVWGHCPPRPLSFLGWRLVQRLVETP